MAHCGGEPSDFSRPHIAQDAPGMQVFGQQYVEKDLDRFKTQTYHAEANAYDPGIDYDRCKG